MADQLAETLRGAALPSLAAPRLLDSGENLVGSGLVLAGMLVVVAAPAALAALRRRQRSGAEAGPPEDPNIADRSTGAEPDVACPVDDPAEVIIRLFGPVRLHNAAWELTPQQLAFVTYLACVGEATREAIVDALWDGRAVSKSRFPNLLAEVRAKIGRHRIPEAVAGRYRVVGITTDLALMERAAAAQAVGLDDADRMMEAALALVGGEPFTVPASRHWAWVSSRTEFANRAEVLATSQAVHLCLRYRRLGELRSAQRVCELGLLAAPLDEDLTAALVDVLLEQGKPSLARRLVENWETRIRGLECGEPAPALRQRLGESPVPGRRQDGGHWTRS